MRTFLSVCSLGALALLALYSPLSAAQQLGKMSVSVRAIGTDSTRSDGEWSKGSFSYRAAFSVTLESDGELLDVNLYDPAFAENMAAQAEAAMARMQAALNGEFNDDEEEAEPDYRYLFYMGQMDCPVELSIEVEEHLEGEYADVGGMQPYTIDFTARSEGSEPERMLLCVGASSVLDIKDEVLYRSALGFPEVSGRYTYTERNRGTLQDNAESRHNALPEVVSDYLFETLRVAPAKGSVRTTLRPQEPILNRINDFGSYEGEIAIEVDWSFDRLD